MGWVGLKASTHELGRTRLRLDSYRDLIITLLQAKIAHLLLMNAGLSVCADLSATEVNCTNEQLLYRLIEANNRIVCNYVSWFVVAIYAYKCLNVRFG